MSIITYANVDTPVFEIDYPRYLFASGEVGTFNDIRTYETSYFTDAGTTPAGIGDPIYQINDQSGNGVNWTQGTLTARPILAREPMTGRRNLLNWTEDFSNSFWGKINISAESELITDSDAPNPVLMRVASLSNQEITSSGELYYYSAEFKPETRSVVWIELGDGGVTGPRVKFDLSGDGEVVYAGGSVHEAAIIPLQDGFYRVSALMTAPTGSPAVRRVSFGLADHTYDNVITTTGDGTGSIRARKISVSPYDTPYQRVTTKYDVTEEGVPDTYSLWFDLGDDSLSTTLPAGTYTVALPTRAGIWIDEVEHAGGTFTLGPTSYTGGPAGILEALATGSECRLIGPPMMIDRALTSSEKSSLVSYYTGRGAGALIDTSGGTNRTMYLATNGAAESNIQVTTDGGATYDVDWGNGNVTTGVVSGAVTSHTYTSAEMCVATITSSADIVEVRSTAGRWRCSVADLPSSMMHLYLQNTDSVITGALSDLPSSMSYLRLQNTSSSITGALSDLPSSMSYLHLQNTSSTITGGTGLSVNAANYLHLGSTGLDSTGVDDLIISAANQPVWAGNKVLHLGGANAARTSASDAAKATLEGYGVTVTVNE